MSRVLLPRQRANVVWFDVVDSTNELASRLMASWMSGEESALPDTIVVAKTQTAGRGRGNNTWQSPPGGLYATWLAWVPMTKLALVPLAAGAALADAVEEVLPGVRVGLKWPNDLQVEGRKLGGVLCQSRSRDGMVWVMVGFGVNVGRDPMLPPGDVVRPTSLRKLGLKGRADAAAGKVLAAFFARIHGMLDAPAPTLAAWKARMVHRRGDPMRLRLPGGVVEGTFASLGDDGQLELEVDGELRQFASGELIQDVAKTGE